ncbi:MAG: alpha/beta hydrolase [Myxococcota bacterium]
MNLSLHHGPLTFSALEAGAGPIVLCLHGFPDHKGSFRFLLPALAAAGYRAVAPTMRGYEPSAQPEDGDYHLSAIAGDVLSWIEELGGQPVHLVGHDWGAVVGYLVAAMAPEKLRSLTTLAIANPGRMQSELWRRRPSQLRKSWYMFYFQLRGIADRAVERQDWALIERLWREWSPGFELPPEEMRQVKDTLAQPGVKQAALGYYRAMFALLAPANREAQRYYGQKYQVPTLAITGALDGCMDTRLHDDLMHASDFPAGLEVVRVEGAGHFLHQERPDEINAQLLRWIARWSPGGAGRPDPPPG